MPIRQRERHRTGHVGWLRAAVLGANDGILSMRCRRAWRPSLPRRGIPARAALLGAPDGFHEGRRTAAGSSVKKWADYDNLDDGNMMHAR